MTLVTELRSTLAAPLFSCLLNHLIAFVSFDASFFKVGLCPASQEVFSLADISVCAALLGSL